ncbi:MAG: Fe-S cluster assembly protein SufD [Agarilytica sp.]
MSDFVSQAAAYAPENTLEWLAPVQKHNAEVWEKVSFPHRKSEDWKYTSLRVLEKGEVCSASPEVRALDDTIVAGADISGLDCFDVVFVNGVYDKALSSPLETLPEGTVFATFSGAEADVQSDIAAALGSIAKDAKHIFAALNASKLNDGVYIRVAKNTKIEKAFRVLNVTLSQAQGATVSPRVLLSIGESAEATLIEQFVSDDAAQSNFVNSVTELDVQANAKLKHYRLHLEDDSALHVGGLHVNLAASAVIDSFHFALGGKLKRIDCVVNHLGAGAHCEMGGVYLPRHKQHVDYHTTIEHAVPHCTTNEVFRGIIADEAKAVFNGRIHIHKDAQKTFAQLSNKNLLTSNKAEIDTKPELEIYADDVQCAHGATVAQLNETSMHYLRTRGVSEKEARMMLSFGFINELINNINDKAVADYLRPQIAELFSRDPVDLESLL